MAMQLRNKLDATCINTADRHYSLGRRHHSVLPTRSMDRDWQNVGSCRLCNPRHRRISTVLLVERGRPSLASLVFGGSVGWTVARGPVGSDRPSPAFRSAPRSSRHRLVAHAAYEFQESVGVGVVGTGNTANPPWFDDVRKRLLRQGLPPSYVVMPWIQRGHICFACETLTCRPNGHNAERSVLHRDTKSGRIGYLVHWLR